MNFLNLTEIYRAVTKLLDLGWTIPGIERLSKFRNRFQHTSLDLSDLTADIVRCQATSPMQMNTSH